MVWKVDNHCGSEIENEVLAGFEVLVFRALSSTRQRATVCSQTVSPIDSAINREQDTCGKEIVALHTVAQYNIQYQEHRVAIRGEQGGNQTHSGHKIVIFRMNVAKLAKYGGFCGRNSPNVDLWRIL